MTDTTDVREQDQHRPNPRRVAAGRLNREKRGPLTDEGRERLRRAALANRPWEDSTGPRSPRGKMQARLNGKLRQKEALSVREARAELAGVRALIRSIRDICGGVDDA